MVEKITLEQLQQELQTRDVTLVEALGPAYFEDAHLPGAINIPHDRVDELAPRLLPDKDARIVVYCANGPCQNSEIATLKLGKLGYTNVADYHEGKAEWLEAGLPIERGSVAA
jgi:rhodanese-related sulfurtransferase